MAKRRVSGVVVHTDRVDGRPVVTMFGHTVFFNFTPAGARRLAAALVATADEAVAKPTRKAGK